MKSNQRSQEENKSMSENVTDWYPTTVSPVHVGWYEIKFGDLPFVGQKFFWNGNRWNCKDGLGFGEKDFPGDKWRGLKAPAQTKPSIDWSHVDSQWRWLAVDDNGYAYLFATRPDSDRHYWLDGSGKWRRVHDLLTSYLPGTCNWKDSLVERPEGV